MSKPQIEMEKAAQQVNLIMKMNVNEVALGQANFPSPFSKQSIRRGSELFDN